MRVVGVVESCREEWLPIHNRSGCTELSDFGVKPEARRNEREHATLAGRGKGGAYEE